MVRCDETAWTAFHRQYFDWLYATAHIKVGNRSDADDIVQLTFLRAVRHIKIFREESEFKNWLQCLMRCVVIDRARKLDRRNILIEKFTLWQQLRGDSGQRRSDINQDQLQEALELLPHHDAQLLKLKYMDGWSTRELAKHDQTTPKAIESKLARLRKSLKANLSKTI